MVNIGMKFIHLQVNEDVVYPVSENQATSGEAETNYRMEDESMSEESDNTSTAGENISMIDEPNSPIASIESDLEDMPDPVVEDSDPSPEHCSITSKIQRYDSTLYEKFEAITPLYEGSSVSVLQAVTHHMLWFTEHPGTSKDALSGILHMQHTKVLPQPNLLPDSYCAALKLIEPFLIQPLVFDVCPNDCIIFRGAHATLSECPICTSKRYKTNLTPCRRFRYLPIGPRLERLFGTPNLAQIVQAHGLSATPSILHDIHDSYAWSSAYSEGGIFKTDPRGISFGLCTDGVNPFSHLRTSYSMWPIVLSLLNLPRKTRHNFGNLLLVGIVPGNGKHEAKNIQPYLEILVDELISLSNTTIYDAYQQATFELKVEILLHILDYPGIGKVFNIYGAGAYKGCAWCNVQGMDICMSRYTFCCD